MAIIVDILVPYLARVIKRGRRHEEMQAFFASVPMRVPEYAGNRAPVVLRAVMADGRPMIYRQIAGGLTRPLIVGFGRREIQVTAHNITEILAAFRHDLYYGSRQWPFLPEFYETLGWVMEDGADVRRMVQTNRDERIRAYREAFEIAAGFVDGVLYVPSLGPAWVIRSGPEMHAGLRVELGHERCRQNPQDWVFAWNEREQAEDMVRISAEAGRGPGPGPRIAGETMGCVIDCTGLSAHAAHESQVAGAAEALLALAGPLLHRMSPKAITAYADLKAVVATGVTSDTVAGATMAIHRFHEHWEPFNCGQPMLPGVDPLADLTARTDEALECLIGLDGHKFGP